MDLLHKKKEQKSSPEIFVCEAKIPHKYQESYSSFIPRLGIKKFTSQPPAI